MDCVREITFRSLLLLALALTAGAAEKESATPVEARLKSLDQNIDFLEQTLAKRIDDLTWFERLRDIAVVDKVSFTGPPPRYVPNPTAQGASNEVIIRAYTFVPRERSAAKIPLVVFAHGGVHGNFRPEYDLHIVRELIEQGYGIIAPDYRGSSGYGRQFWELIDYGGREVEDVFLAKEWMLENHANIDPARVGILGWSHGGLIALMNVFGHPKDFKAAYAGVPVTDLVARMGYKGQGYRELFAAPYHIGKSAEDDVKEYRRRSPVWNAEKLETPLLIHGNTNDEDVNILEVEAMINALKAAGKKFEHKIYTNAPAPTTSTASIRNSPANHAPRFIVSWRDI